MLLLPLKHLSKLVKVSLLIKLPPKDCMVVINTDGMFFLICKVNNYYPNIKRLSQVLPKWDVVWNDVQQE